MSKDLTKALRKFNNMYEHVTAKHSSTDEYRIVRNYGRNMTKMFPDFFSKQDEASGRIDGLTRQINFREGQ